MEINLLNYIWSIAAQAPLTHSLQTEKSTNEKREAEEDIKLILFILASVMCQKASQAWQINKYYELRSNCSKSMLLVSSVLFISQYLSFCVVRATFQMRSIA